MRKMIVKTSAFEDAWDAPTLAFHVMFGIGRARQEMMMNVLWMADRTRLQCPDPSALDPGPMVLHAKCCSGRREDSTRSALQTSMKLAGLIWEAFCSGCLRRGAHFYCGVGKWHRALEGQVEDYVRIKVTT